MRKVIFLDRDGVINKDPGGWTKHNYVTKWEEFRFVDGAIEALKRLKDAGFRICIVSNQGGISRGYFTQSDLDELNRRISAEVKKGGGAIDEFYYCPHHDEDNCGCRKPRTGLIEQAMQKARFDAGNTFIVGDDRRDIELGKNMGMKTIFVLSGKRTLSDTKDWPVQPDYIKKDLGEAVEFILKKKRGGDA